MAASGLNGPYPLTENGIDTAVKRASAGAYALGHSYDNGSFRVSYVGRSDNDVKARLREHVARYSQFEFAYCDSAKAAFDRQCALYHDFSPPDNKAHPDRPEGRHWQCPRCQVFD